MWNYLRSTLGEEQPTYAPNLVMMFGDNASVLGDFLSAGINAPEN